jgi:methylmalonyl-CoA/ethylmalonyl-CoA epimerase
MKHNGLDHLAMVVPDTESALKVWRDTLGLPLLYSETVNGGNTHLQLVEPLTPDHLLQAWLAKNGPGLHHFCLEVDAVGEAMKTSPVPTASNSHQGTQDKQAVFLDKEATQGVQVELSGR